MIKKCIACGMPMEKPEDFPLGDKTRDYCVHCSRPDGSMQSYEERLEAATSFIVKTQGISESIARKTAIELMSKLPAWEDRN